MNRQRRIEAIARQRAYIDSQIRMLSACNETRVPNIIRSRTGRPNPNAKSQRTQMIQHVDHSVNATSRQQQGPVEVVHQDLAFSQPVNDLASPGPNHVYLTIVNTDNVVNSNSSSGVIQNSTQQMIPIELTSDVAEMLASNEQFQQPLQTIKTNDGTVMVVLDGSEFYNDTQIIQKTGADADNAEMDASQGVPVTTITEESTPVVEEETFFIVSTPEGDILVPSNAVSVNNQFQISTNDETGLVELLQADDNSKQVLEHLNNTNPTPNGREQLNSHSTLTSSHVHAMKSNSDHLLIKQAVPKTRILSRSQPAKPRHVVNGNSSTGKSAKTANKISSNKQRLAVTNAKLLHKYVSPTPPQPHNISMMAEEKPRPFRFELPDLEDIMDDGFMSVPIPIKIESLRSETNCGGSANNYSPSSIITEPDQSETQSQQIESTSVEECKITESCPECNANFMDRKSLVAHMEELHQELRLFQCGQCSERFSYEVSLTNHTRLHERQRKFQCGRCSKYFQYESTCSSHEKYCGSEIFQCDTLEADPIENSDVNDKLQECVEIDSTNQEQTEATPQNQEDVKVSRVCSIISDSHPDESVSNNDITSHVSTSDKEHNQGVYNSNCSSYDTASIAASHDRGSEPVCKKIKFEGSKVEKADRIDTQLQSHTPKIYIETETGTPVGTLTLINSSESVTYDGQQCTFSPHTVESVGRRTLHKATAKADMTQENLSDVWESQNRNLVREADSKNCNKGTEGQSISPQSARIRARNIRIRDMDGKAPNEEEISVNFRNIFKQVVVKNGQGTL